MFKSFAIVALAGVASAVSIESYQEIKPYSTSYSGPAKTSNWINEYRPDVIPRDQLQGAQRGVGQYRSVDWGKDGYYSSWRDINPMEQAASQARPSYTNTLISPDGIVGNSYTNMYTGSKYAGYNQGMMARSEGVNYNDQVYKRTQNNGFRRDTKSTEYLHTWEPSRHSTFVKPKPYQVYDNYVDSRTVADAGYGTIKTGDDQALSYPKYTTEVLAYEKPVVQHYTQAYTVKDNPETPEYVAPQYNFLEYDVKEPTKIHSTYYEAPVVYGEHTWGSLANEREYTPIDWDIGYSGEYNGVYDPMAVLPRYPAKQVQTYDQNVIRETQLQPHQYEQVKAEHALSPKFEENMWTEPIYTDPRIPNQHWGTQVNQ